MGWSIDTEALMVLYESVRSVHVIWVDSDSYCLYLDWQFFAFLTFEFNSIQIQCSFANIHKAFSPANCESNRTSGIDLHTSVTLVN